MSIDLQRFQIAYFEESREGLDEMESGLLALEAGERDARLIDSVFRAAHSIKGGAATFGFSAMAELTHLMETLLEQVRAGERRIDTATIEALLGSVDVLRSLLDEVELRQLADPARVRAAHQKLQALLDGTIPAAAPATAADPAADPAADHGLLGWRIGFHPGPDLFLSGNDPLQVLRDLDTLGPVTATPDVDGLPPFEELEPLQAALAWMLELQAPAPRSEVQAVFEWVEDLCRLELTPVRQQVAEALDEHPDQGSDASAAAEVAGQAREAAEGSIRVGVGKVDGLVNLVGELVVTQSMLQQLGTGSDPALAERMGPLLELLERNTRDLQEAILGIRMLPVDAVFRRFPRLVRDLSGKLGKLVRLQVQGQATELDKGLIEKITDPLVHLVRNAIDHGLEDPDGRAAAGKDPTGTISLTASHQDGHVVIEVEDDGRGLDRERILAKARERGLPVPEDATDAQVWDFVFHPGFSTVGTVTDLSGRGVGMDVVRSNIRQLGGTVEIRSRAGEGTRVVIRLPLTLAIMDGMTVSAGGETLVLPLANVRETLQPRAQDVSTVKGQGRLLKVRGAYLPLLSLAAVYGAGGGSGEAPLAVVVEGDGHRMAVEVDALVGQQQIVVKSLERNYRHVDGISGATILGDGRVALIVDVGGLARTRLLAAAA